MRVNRWHALGLREPFDNHEPASMSVADLLMLGLRAPGESTDPVVAILHGIMHEAQALATLLRDSDDLAFLAPTVDMIANRAQAAFLLLRKADVCPVPLAAPAADEGPETQPSTPTTPAK